MSQSLIIPVTIEVCLVIATALCLIQPRFLFRWKAQWISAVAYWLGILLLLVTFLWSILLGLVMSIHQVGFGFL